MLFNTDVLIVGGGPTGLMFACQLARFGVSCRIIDKQADRAHESRAFGIQAKSMEIFQNLGVVSEFKQRAQVGDEAYFYVNGKLKFKLDFKNIDVKDTPFPAIFLLPQSETERILLEHLEKLNIQVERETELISFIQNKEGIEANIKKELTGENEKIYCRYIIGSDGAHSTVRHTLNIPFLGASYQQEFILIDTTIQWPFPMNNPVLFLSKKGNLVHIPLSEKFCRLIIINSSNNSQQLSDRILTAEEMQNMVEAITGSNIQLINPSWISRFRLHHRVVQHYQKDRAFLAGDAAHIHSPVGGQGMNTGLQDATNLAWKIAFVIKYHAPEKLLETYESERRRIGEILLKTTDRIFGWVASKNFFVAAIRQYVVPILMKFLTKSAEFRQRSFCFISQLAIHYHPSAFVIEKAENADPQFLSGPKAGCRAPDAPLSTSSLFELFREKPANILLFQAAALADAQQEKNILALKKIHSDVIAIYQFMKSPDMELIFDRYGISTSGVYFIRPDGYIGFRSYGMQLDGLLQYLHQLFGQI